MAWLPVITSGWSASRGLRHRPERARDWEWGWRGCLCWCWACHDGLLRVIDSLMDALRGVLMPRFLFTLSAPGWSTSDKKTPFRSGKDARGKSSVRQLRGHRAWGMTTRRTFMCERLQARSSARRMARRVSLWVKTVGVSRVRCRRSCRVSWSAMATHSVDRADDRAADRTRRSLSRSPCRSRCRRGSAPTPRAHFDAGRCRSCTLSPVPDPAAPRRYGARSRRCSIDTR